MCKASAGQAGRKRVGWLRIMGPVWKEGRREVLAGWRRKGMCWRSESMGLCKEVGQEGVGRLAPE